MTEADIVQRLREMQADMNDAIEKMDASAFDTGMMRQIRAEQHDFYKEAADEIERLRAEVEALRRTATDRAGIIDSVRAVREWTRGVVNDNWALRAEVEALRAERDAMAKDAERYRWLRGDLCPDHSVRWAQWEVRCWRAPFWTGDLRREELDGAIDAAMAQAKDAEAR